MQPYWGCFLIFFLHFCVYLYLYLYDRRGMQPCQRCLTSFKYLVVFKKGVTRVKIFPTCNCKFNASIRDYLKKKNELGGIVQQCLGLHKVDPVLFDNCQSHICHI